MDCFLLKAWEMKSDQYHPDSFPGHRDPTPAAAVKAAVAVSLVPGEDACHVNSLREPASKPSTCIKSLSRKLNKVSTYENNYIPNCNIKLGKIIFKVQAESLTAATKTQTVRCS